VGDPLRTLARGVTRRRPVYAMVQVTARCNLRCRMCQVWTLEHGDASELPAARFPALARALYDVGVRVVTVAGEPFLRDDLDQVVAAFAGAGLFVRIQTNGTLITPSSMDAVLDAGLSGISLSVHSLDPVQMDHICNGEGVLERVEEGLAVVRDRTRGRRGFLGIVNMVLSRSTLGEVERVLDLATSMGARLSIIPLHLSTVRQSEPQFAAHHPDHAAMQPEDLAELRRVVERLVQVRRRSRRILNSTRYLRMLPAYFEGRCEPWPCLAGTSYLFVDHNGLVAPCHELDAVGSIFDPAVVTSALEGDLGGISRQTRQACPGCLLPCWTELSLMFSDPRSFLEAVEVNLAGGPASRGQAIR